MHTSCSTVRKYQLCVAGGLLLLAAGCGGKLSTVSGKVLYKGKPLPGGRVVFLHETGASSSLIGEDGSYRIDKVPLGPVKIVVIGPPGASSKVRNLSKKTREELKHHLPKMKTEDDKVSKELMVRMMGNDGDKKPTVAIPAKYGNPKKSGLTYTVDSGSQTYDIKLE